MGVWGVAFATSTEQLSIKTASTDSPQNCIRGLHDTAVCWVLRACKDVCRLSDIGCESELV